MSDPTLITFILDRSGSMASCLDATIEGFNAYVDGLRVGDGADETSFSLIQFDSQGIDMTWKNAPLSDVTGINKHNYVPRGGTPLIDAAFKAIKATEKRVAEIATLNAALSTVDSQPASPKVVICVQTDGEENSSTQHGWDELNALIKEKTALGWQFNFMGVGLDAYKQAARFGLTRGQTLSYNDRDLGQTRAAFVASSANAASFRAGATADTAYSAQQKADAGDQFDLGDLHGSVPLADPLAAFDPDSTTAKIIAARRALHGNPIPQAKPVAVDDIEL